MVETILIVTGVATGAFVAYRLMAIELRESNETWAARYADAMKQKDEQIALLQETYDYSSASYTGLTLSEILKLTQPAGTARQVRVPFRQDNGESKEKLR